jgi:hypothetical protein
MGICQEKQTFCYTSRLRDRSGANIMKNSGAFPNGNVVLTKHKTHKKRRLYVLVPLSWNSKTSKSSHNLELPRCVEDSQEIPGPNHPSLTHRSAGSMPRQQVQAMSTMSAEPLYVSSPSSVESFHSTSSRKHQVSSLTFLGRNE